MTTDNPTVGSGAESGATGSPNQEASQQVSQPIESDVHQLLKAYGEKLESVTKELRGLQGRQDKSDNQYSDFRKQLARLDQYKSQGLSDTEALAEMEADDANDQWRKTLEQKIDGLVSLYQSGGTATNREQMVATVLSEYGLDPRDPFVAGKLNGQSFKTKEEVELAAARILRDKTLAPQTNASQQSASTGNVNPRASDLDAVYAEYAEAFKAPTQNAERMKQLEEQMKRLGG